jgi:hypothetical protein
MTQTARRFQVRPEVVDVLEPRALCTLVGLTAHASPMILTQIDPQNQPHPVQVSVIRPVTFAGTVSVVSKVPPTVPPTISFQVVDEYGKDQPSGTIPAQIYPASVSNQFPFFFTKRIGLNRFRRHGDLDGRQYTIVITAKDAQTTLTTSIPLTTPPPRLGR